MKTVHCEPQFLKVFIIEIKNNVSSRECRTFFCVPSPIFVIVHVGLTWPPSCQYLENVLVSLHLNVQATWAYFIHLSCRWQPSTKKQEKNTSHYNSNTVTPWLSLQMNTLAQSPNEGYTQHHCDVLLCLLLQSSYPPKWESTGNACTDSLSRILRFSLVCIIPHLSLHTVQNWAAAQKQNKKQCIHVEIVFHLLQQKKKKCCLNVPLTRSLVSEPAALW